METQKRTALEASGWQFGDAADFLGMTDEERQLLDLRVAAAFVARQQREARQFPIDPNGMSGSVVDEDGAVN